MKKHGIGKRLLSVLLALTMIVSVIPFSVFAADGDLRDGETGLDSNINTLDTISWPIKVYDYLNDGLLFEYASAQDSSMTNLGGDAYGGGAKMPGDISYGGKILGSDFTVNSSESNEYYDSYSYSYWLKSKSGYRAATAQQGSGTAGAFKFLRLEPYKDYTDTDMPAMVISDFTIDNSTTYTSYRKYAGGTTSYPKERVRYAVLVYKTNMNNLELTMGMSTNLAGTYTVKDYNRNNTTGPDGYAVTFDLVESKYLPASNTWNYVIVDMKSGPNAAIWDNIQRVTQIILDTNMTTPDEQYLDLSHIAYFSSEEEAIRFGEAAKAFDANPGEFLCDQYYTANGTTYSKHWNMGNNTAFTMLYANDGGGWNETSGKGGTNSWTNGYYSYQIGYDTTSATSNANNYRNTAKNNGYPVPDDIYFFYAYSDPQYLEDYNFGYTLYNYVSTGVMTAGLLENDLINVVGADGKTYRIPQYKQGTVDYITYVVRNSLTIGQKDQYGNYNYNFVQGSPSDQFIVDGKPVDLATALRSALGMKAAANNKGNYTYPASAMGSYEATIAKADKLIGAYADVKDNIKTFHDAAYYLLHNLFVDNSYNQLQDDYNYLVLSKAPVTGTGKEAFVFDAGFTTGNIESDANSESAIVYNKNNGTISLSSALGKDEICYNGNQWTTRNPFLPVTDAEGDYGCTGTPYFREDGARTYADYGDTYVNRNYNYVMQANAEFIYHYQDDLFFQFEGDDDVYLFVNGELVLDIGAAHSITSVKMQMNDYVLAAQEKMAPFKQKHGYRADMTDAAFEEVLNKAVAAGTIKESQKDEYRRWHHLNLVDGESYSIDFYYMERHGWGANMRVATNIVMTDPAMVTEKKAYQDGTEIHYGGVVEEDKKIEYSFSMTNNGTNKLYNLTFHDYDIGISLTPEDGLVFHEKALKNGNVTDARGLTLDVSDLVVQVDGYKDKEKTQPVSLQVTFDGQNPEEQLKKFLTDLTSNDGTAEEEADSLYAGKGLWKDATVTIRGIYYKLTKEQIADEQFRNVVFTTANPAVDSEIVLNSEDTHQVRLIGDALHIYQWAGHPVYFNREDVAEWKGGTIKVGNQTYQPDEILITTCRKDGTAYDYPDIMVDDQTSMTVNYLEPGTKLTFIKILRDTNKDGEPDDIDGDGKITEADYLTVLPLAVYGTNVEDDVVVLDYGLAAELTGKNGITVNDYLAVPNLGTKYSIMGMTKKEPKYLPYTDSASYNNNNINRISFEAVEGNSIAFEGGGTYEYTKEEGDDKLFFTPTSFMADVYTIYLAVTIHEDDITPSKVGTANSNPNGYDVDITKEVQMYHKITVLPATVMYYEDDFISMNYNNAGSEAFNKEGTGSDKLQQGVDQSVNYGADQVYQTEDNAQISGNSMTSIKISKLQPETSFTFKGTGFEIIGRTNAYDSSSFMVTVKKDGKIIRRLPVITEFSNKENVCKHTTHKTNGHCDECNTYVGHVYHKDVCIKCQAIRTDYYLVGYINEADYGCQDDWKNLGEYKFVNGKLTTTFKSDGYVYIKTPTQNPDEFNWFMTDGYPGTGTRAAFFYNTNMGIDANKLHVPGGVPLTFTLVENNDGTLTLSYTTADDDVTDLDRTVYFRNTENWENVKIYYWAVDNASLTEWPGEDMSLLGDSIYSFSLPADAQFVIFHNGEGVQTPDLTVPADNMVYGYSGFNKGWSEYNPGERTLHFDNTVSGWGKVYAYYWSENNETMIAWPGQEMKAGTDNSFTAVIPSEATKVIFSNGSGSQTADLTILIDGDTFVYGSGWKSQGDDVANGRTVFFQNTAGWSNVNVHYWDINSQGQLVKWPGDAMELVEDDIYAAVIPAEATHVKFNAGEDASQTQDIELSDEGNLFVYAPTSSGWSVYGEVATFAVTRAATAETLYLKPNSNWVRDGARFAAYFFGGGETWVSMTDSDGDGIYECAVPSGYTSVIFCRMNPGDSNNTWNTKWNQTSDLTIPTDGTNCYTVEDGSWDYGAGTWSTISGSSVDPEPENNRIIYFDNTNTNWSQINIHAWNDIGDLTGGWPGAVMELVEGNIYGYEIPGNAQYVIFSNNGESQTENLTIPADKNLFSIPQPSSGAWEQYEAQRTLYFNLNGADWTGVYAYYWTDGSDGPVAWPGVQMTHVEGTVYSVQIPLDAQFVKFNNNEGTETGTLSIGNSYAQLFTYQTTGVSQSEATRMIYYKSVGTGSISVTYWNSSNTRHTLDMVLVKDGIYSCRIPMDTEGVIFTEGDQVSDELLIPDEQDLYADGEWDVYDVTAEYRPSVYFTNDFGWKNVHVYYWSSTNGDMTSWPGVPMTFVEKDLCTARIPVGADRVIFCEVDENGNSVAQTGNLIKEADKDLFTAEQRSVIYFNNDQVWKNVYAYFWSDENPEMYIWPGLPMTVIDNQAFIDIPAGATKVIFSDVKDGQVLAQTQDLSLDANDAPFNIVSVGGDWSNYEKPRTDAIHQVPTMRVELSEYGEYEVEISGQPSYNVDWNVYNSLPTAEEKQAYLARSIKDVYLYIDGVRIYQPLPSEYHYYYPEHENGAQFKELRDLILEGYASVAAYKFYEADGEEEAGTVIYSGNVSWTENRNGKDGKLDKVYKGNQVASVDDYLLVGPNNETYLNGNAQTQAVIFFVKEDPDALHGRTLQIAARGLDAGLFMGSGSTGVNATLYQGVRLELPDGTVTYGWKPIDTIVSGTEQYYTLDYTACPYTVDADGQRVYQVAMYVRSGMVSFTSVKYNGLKIDVNDKLGSTSIFELSGGVIYDFQENPDEGQGSGSTEGTQPTEGTKAAAVYMSSISAQMNAIETLEDSNETQGTITLSYPTLSFEDEILYNIYYKVSDLDVSTDNMGLAIFDSKRSDGTVDDAIALVPGALAENGLFCVSSNGIAAKDLNKELYFKIYAQLADGSYVYSPVANYSAASYAKSILSGSASKEMKALVVAMLNYGAAAQQYFGTEGALLNAQLTAEQKALVSGYSADLLNKVVRADDAKAGAFAASGKGFEKQYPTVSFEGAFAINYYFTPSEVVQGNMKLYYWTEADYNAAEVLTAENATGISTMTGLNSYSAAVKQIAAKDMDSTIYVAAVYSSNGKTYSSGVMAYSLGSYCDTQAAANGSISSFAEAAAVYGAYAKSYFGK